MKIHNNQGKYSKMVRLKFPEFRGEKIKISQTVYHKDYYQWGEKDLLSRISLSQCE